MTDWVGRCIAESKTAGSTVFCTTTYSEDSRYYAVANNVPAHMLLYGDVQRWLKRLRFAYKGRIRYFVAGEYGSAKGRAHWHAILFFSSALPDSIEFDRRFMHPSWEHGFSFFQEFTPKSARYCCKYLVKSQADEAVKAMGLSLKPPIGDAYFRLEAGKYAEAGLSPQRLEYGFADDEKVYHLRGASAFNFLTAFAEQWRARWGQRDWPSSELMERWQEESDRRERVRLCLPDWPDAEFGERLLQERNERRGKWLQDVPRKGALSADSNGPSNAYSDRSGSLGRA